VAMPDVVGQPFAEAEPALVEQGFVSGAVTTENSASAAEGIVLATTPLGGDQTPVGSIVDFTVSSGQVSMPDVVGQALTAANALLQADDLQLVPSLVPDYTCESESGSPVSKQSLPPGDVPQKSAVELTYCAG